MRQGFPHLYENIIQLIKFFYEFVIFVSNNNPILLISYIEDDIKDEEHENAVVKVEQKKQLQIKYEDKYLDKFKEFPNQFTFTELELDEEVKEYEKIKVNFEKHKKEDMCKIQEELFKINEIYEKVGNDNKFIVNDDNKRALIDFNGLYIEYDDELDGIDFNELYEHVIERKLILEKELQEIKQKSVTDDEICLKAHEFIIKTKLDKFINNYIVEHTPLGNVYMRYNNDKGSFEYFSNNSIPYRYLEPIGRRYVMAYWCKPIFVDMQEELKMSEIKFDLKREEDE